MQVGLHARITDDFIFEKHRQLRTHAVAFHLFKVQFDGLLDIRQRLVYGVPLRVAAGYGGANHDVPAVFVAGFEKNLEIQRLRCC